MPVWQVDSTDMVSWHSLLVHGMLAILPTWVPVRASETLGSQTRKRLLMANSVRDSPQPKRARAPSLSANTRDPRNEPTPQHNTRMTAPYNGRHFLPAQARPILPSPPRRHPGAGGRTCSCASSTPATTWYRNPGRRPALPARAPRPRRKTRLSVGSQRSRA